MRQGQTPNGPQVTFPAAFWLVSFFSKSPGGPIPEPSIPPRSGRDMRLKLTPFPCVPPCLWLFPYSVHSGLLALS